MSVAISLIPGLDEIVRNGDPKRRAGAARRIADLFLQGAAHFQPDHVELFDGVLVDLVPHSELAVRAALAERLSVLSNAPRGLVGQLAREDEISIAGPLLRRSPVLDEKALIEIARMKGQGHLLAIAERPALSPDLTDVIVRRGQCGGTFFANRILDADQARRPGRRSDARGRSARRSVGAALEGSSGGIDRHRPPPPVRCGEA